MTNIVIADVRFLMSKGYTRTPEDPAYDAAIGSIAEYYNISNDQVKLVFRDPRMKGIRTRKQAAPQFVLSDAPATLTAATFTPNTVTATGISSTNDDTVTTSTTVEATEEVFETVND